MACLRARARKDGCGAAQAAAGKRRRYANAGPSLVPFALEDGGRPGEDTESLVRRMAASRTDAEEGSLEWGGAGRLWQELSMVRQIGNAEQVLSANGR